MKHDSNRKFYILAAAPAVILVAALAVWTSGCKSPSKYRAEADKVAADIIAQKQQQALGRTESFTINRSEDSFRKRLIRMQALQVAGPESLGTDNLPKPKDWPEKDAKKDDPSAQESAGPAVTSAPVRLSLFDALAVAASNSREYQSQKESLFRTALDLDLRRNDFRNIFSSRASSDFTTDHSQGGTPVNTNTTSASLDWSRLFATGASVSAGLAVDIASILTTNHASSRGLVADMSVSVPLLKGAGRRVVMEPLTQAERNVVYGIYSFEEYKRDFAVRVASQYLDVLGTLDSVKNAQDNYRSLVTSGRRARRLADAGRLSGIQVDQAYQDELRARTRWITAMASYDRSLDTFKNTLGLPTDAKIELDPDELDRLAVAAQTALGAAALSTRKTPSAASTESSLAAEAAPAVEPTDSALGAAEPVILEGPSREDAGPYEIDEDLAVKLALENRLDLRTSIGQVYDAQRQVIIAANAFLPGLNLNAGGRFGGRPGPTGDDANLRPQYGTYDASLSADIPWNKVSQRNAYRRALISLESSERSLQQLEDQVKSQIRNDLRTLLTARESIKIQFVAVDVARSRVRSVELFLQAGRAQIRDLLDAQEALVSAQDQLTSNLVDYRVAVLGLQRDMGLLETDEKGMWREYDPAKFKEQR